VLRILVWQYARLSRGASVSPNKQLPRIVILNRWTAQRAAAELRR
jgi:hypothetical protein